MASMATWFHQLVDLCGLDALSQVEHLPPGHTLDKTGWSETDREVNTKLYSILTSYLRGSPLQLSRLLGNEKDGLRLWQLLRDQYAPVTRSRQLALSQAISSFPCFDTNKALSASITELEQLVNEFEMLSGKRYDNDIFDPIRNHLTLTVTPSTTYETAKEAILSYERSSKTWGSGECKRSEWTSSIRLFPRPNAHGD